MSDLNMYRSRVVRACAITNGTLAEITPKLIVFNSLLVYNPINPRHSKGWKFFSFTNDNFIHI
jgi:hypothetical protein